MYIVSWEKKMCMYFFVKISTDLHKVVEIQGGEDS